MLATQPVEKATQVLSLPQSETLAPGQGRAQVHLNVKGLLLGEDDNQVLGFDWLRNDILKSVAPEGIQNGTVTAVLTDLQHRTALDVLKRHSAVEV